MRQTGYVTARPAKTRAVGGKLQIPPQSNPSSSVSSDSRIKVPKAKVRCMDPARFARLKKDIREGRAVVTDDLGCLILAGQEKVNETVSECKDSSTELAAGSIGATLRVARQMYRRNNITVHFADAVGEEAVEAEADGIVWTATSVGRLGTPEPRARGVTYRGSHDRMS